MPAFNNLTTNLVAHSETPWIVEAPGMDRWTESRWQKPGKAPTYISCGGLSQQIDIVPTYLGTETERDTSHASHKHTLADVRLLILGYK